MNERILELEHELQRNKSAFQDFAYAVSHDLQAPLRHIMGYSQDLLSVLDDNLSKRAHEDLVSLQKSTLLMQQMLESLLEYSRIETRGKPFTTVSCNDVLKVVLENYSKEIKEKSATISSDSLPEINGDPTQIYQLFKQLIGNALKFNSDAAPEILITVTQEKKLSLFRIQDNGIGIDPRHLDRIFVIFQRLGIKPHVEGLGSGLALCKRIVERHQGQIWCESTLGEGSAFLLRIPLR
ncbi:MAG: ATP-binding protein [Planctomycetaceae bacterium]